MNVLLVETDIATLNLLDDNISKWNHDVYKALNGPQLFELLENIEFDIIISGCMIPEMNGAQLCRKIRSLDSKRYIYLMFIVDKEKCKDLARGLPNGVDDYVTQPLNFEELRARLEIGVRIIRLERELNQKYLAIKRNYYQAIHMFTQLLESYNRELGGHSRRVGKLALELAQRHPQIKPEDFPIIEAAGLLHDIGLIGLPEALVTKTVPEMTGDEKRGYQAHPERGEFILNQVDLLRPVARLVRMHHEQINGRGFPDGLTDKQIPLAAMVVGAASVYDHLVHHKRIPLEHIAERLQHLRGYQISGDLIDLLLAINLERIEAEAKRNYCEIDIDDLQAGMILACDIHMRTGAFVMGADTSIDASVVDKLKRYHELGNIGSNVFIKK